MEQKEVLIYDHCGNKFINPAGQNIIAWADMGNGSPKNFHICLGNTLLAFGININKRNSKVDKCLLSIIKMAAKMSVANG